MFSPVAQLDSVNYKPDKVTNQEIMEYITSYDLRAIKWRATSFGFGHVLDADCAAAEQFLLLGVEKREQAYRLIPRTRRFFPVNAIRSHNPGRFQHSLPILRGIPILMPPFLTCDTTQLIVYSIHDFRMFCPVCSVMIVII